MTNKRNAARVYRLWISGVVGEVIGTVITIRCADQSVGRPAGRERLARRHVLETKHKGKKDQKQQGKKEQSFYMSLLTFTSDHAFTENYNFTLTASCLGANMPPKIWRASYHQNCRLIIFAL